jgi:CubicO group peptidase (beta-lactamase class C family)
MSELKLPQVAQVVTKALETGQIPGAVVVVTAEGKLVHSDARGVPDPGSSHRLEADSILWLASMSKPVCTVALLTLADEGKLDVDDPVSRFIPEFAAAGRVRVLPPGTPPPPHALPFGPPPEPLPVYDEVPAEREITIKDLLTHTSGLQTIFRWNSDYVPPVPGDTLASHVPGLARVVRDFQAGAEWAYSNAAGFDVLSRVAEVASGLDFDDLLRSRVFLPLGIDSIGFGLAGVPRAVPVDPVLMANPVIRGEGYFSGAAGLWGDAESYLRFAWMLRDGRTLGGAELLSPAAVRRMTSNQVGGLHPELAGRGTPDGVGFGLSVAVVTSAAAAGLALSDGSFGWDGVATRRFWVDPAGGYALFMYVPDPQVQQEIEAGVAADIS